MSLPDSPAPPTPSSPGLPGGENARQEGVAQQLRLLQAISRAQAQFISGARASTPFEVLLVEFLSLTASGYGFVGEVLRDEAGAPCLKAQAMTPRAGHDLAQAEGGLVFPRPGSLLGQIMVTGEAVVVNDAVADPPDFGLPEGHFSWTSFVGLPIHAGEGLVAVVGLANRVGGYTMEDVLFLQPLLHTVGQFIQARRAEQERNRVQAQLRQTSELLAQKTQALEITLNTMTQGITNVDAQGRIRVYNRRYLELLDLPEALLKTQPPAEDVVRLQTERGDFGQGFELIEPQARDYVSREYFKHGDQLSVPPLYLRRTRSGRVIEVKTQTLQAGGRVRTFTDVTPYFEAQEALRQSEARWRSLTQLTADWYWEQDEHHRYVRFEGQCAEGGGMPSQAMLGHCVWDTPALNLNVDDWAAHRRCLDAREVFVDFELQRQPGGAQPHWVALSGAPVFDAMGHFKGYRGIGRNITARKQAEADIERMAFYDDLTGLPNRRLLLDRLGQALQWGQRRQGHGALVHLDLDNFKDLNDTLGHERGDQLLQQVARRLLGCVRACDTVARLGGDEFVVLLGELSVDAHQAAGYAEAVAHKIQAALNQPFVLQGSDCYSTPSLGIALFNGLQHRADELLQRAELAMYQAKAAGRNTLCFFDPAMQAAASARAALEADLRQGLQRGELFVLYQPVVNGVGRLLGAEALVRWQHPQRGRVSPDAFIALAEQTGLILPLGYQVLQAACRQLALWNLHRATEGLTLAVNVSAREFRDPDFVHQVLDTVVRSGANPGRLKLELTESLLLNDVEDSIVKMAQLRARGVSFSLDDFGTGYSSLGYLKRLPLEQLKIDQSFVRDILTDPNDATIARTIIALARSLGLSVVAEGVETAEQRDFLLHHGCPQFQGYLFGRPEHVEALVPLMGG